MNKKFLTYMIIFLVPLMTLACVFSVVKGSGEVTNETRDVSGFNQVTLDGIGTLHIIQGDREELRIEAEGNVLPEIVTNVRNGILSIGFKNDDWSDLVRPTEPIQYYLSVRNLERIELTGAGKVLADDFQSTELEITSSGAGNINITSLSASSVQVTLSGAGNCKITGEVIDQSIVISGAGSYNAEDLTSEDAVVRVSGMGNVKIWALDSLDITISGAGTVKYYGEPTISQVISGAGSIKSLGNR